MSYLNVMPAEKKGTEKEAAAVTEAAKEETLPLWEADWNDEAVKEDFMTKLKREQGKMTS